LRSSLTTFLQQTADTQSLVYCDNGRDLRRKPHGATK
jgi:hypothetical protein